MGNMPTNNDIMMYFLTLPSNDPMWNKKTGVKDLEKTILRGIGEMLNGEDKRKVQDIKDLIKKEKGLEKFVEAVEEKIHNSEDSKNPDLILKEMKELDKISDIIEETIIDVKKREEENNPQSQDKEGPQLSQESSLKEEVRDTEAKQ